MRKLNLILLGAPGAGKGTQAELISERYGIPAISTGQIIREEIASGSELGEAVKSYTSKGELVPDSVVIDIIKARLAKDDCENGFILDGFPRTVPQAAALDEMGVCITDVISIEVADEDIMTRMSGRRVCKKCGATYHVKYKPSPAGENCGVCGEPLTIRADDDPAVVKSRLEIYHAQTEPLKEYYQKAGKYYECDGDKGSIEENRARVLALVESIK
jgi:adenylate kinase